MNGGRYELTQGDRAAYDKLPVPLCLFHSSAGAYRLLCVSDGFCALVGLDREDIFRLPVAGPLLDVLEEDREKARVAGEYALVYPGDESRTVCRLKTADGGSLRVACTARSQELDDGSRLLYLFYTAITGENAQEKHADKTADSRAAAAPRAGDDPSLLCLWRADLTDNRTLAYDPRGPRALAIPLDMPFDAAGAYAGRMPYGAGNQERLTDLLNRDRLLRMHGKGVTLFSLEYRRDENGQMPFWVSLTVNTYAAPETGHVECLIAARDVTETILEKQLISRLTMLGYDLVGLLSVHSAKCRFFRIKKMRLGMDYEQYMDYRHSIECSLVNMDAEERENALRALRLENIVARLADGPSFAFPYAINTLDGRPKRKLLLFSYLDESKDTIFICRSDVTEQYQHEMEQLDRLREAKAEAERAGEAKSMFLSSLSHDLRTPLNGIIGFTNLALHESDDVRRLEDLRKVKSSSDLLLGLVNDTLELSRMESGKDTLQTAPENLREMAGAVLTALSPSAELKGLHFHADTAALPDVNVLTDRLKFQKIFLNLLSNAIKYTPSGGTVEAKITLLAPPENGCNCRLTVRDDGIGISPEFLPHIFDAFSQERRPESANILGTGLGLAIVKRTVTLMGGAVRVDSQLRHGSTFTVDLPLPPAEAAATGAEILTDAEILRGRRVLLCEDNQLNTEIARILLLDLGITVDSAENGREGVSMFRSAAPGAYAAILMDVRMPVMDGCEAARLIRSLDRVDAQTIPIIAMSADAPDVGGSLWREAGMTGCVPKPVDPRHLAAELMRVIRK